MPDQLDSGRSFKIGSRNEKYHNRWMSVVEYEIERDGKPGVYSVVKRPDAVTIVAVTGDQRFLVLKQYRFPTESYSWELPMGGMEAEETPLQAAARELEEETGLQAELTHVGRFRPIPGLTPQAVDVFRAKIPDRMITALENFDTNVDEIVNRRIISRQQLATMIKNDEISDGFTLSSLAVFDAAATSQ